MTAIALAYSSINKKIGSFELPVIDWKKVVIAGFFALASLLVFYVYEINNLTAGAYVIKDYEGQISDLSKENRVLETKFAQNNLLEGITEKTQELGFEKTQEIKYIQIMNTSLAKAK